MAYFIDLFSPETYEAFGRSSRDISGFRLRHLRVLSANAAPVPSNTSNAVPGSGSGWTTFTAKGCVPSTLRAEGVLPPRMAKEPEYSPASVVEGTVTEKSGAVIDCKGDSDAGKFRKNGVSSSSSGAAMMALSAFKNVELPPVSVSVALKVTVRAGCVVSIDDVSEKLIGVAHAVLPTNIRHKANNGSLTFILSSTLTARRLGMTPQSIHRHRLR
jgi:hypothetical protein